MKPSYILVGAVYVIIFALVNSGIGGMIRDEWNRGYKGSAVFGSTLIVCFNLLILSLVFAAFGR